MLNDLLYCVVIITLSCYYILCLEEECRSIIFMYAYTSLSYSDRSSSSQVELYSSCTE